MLEASYIVLSIVMMILIAIGYRKISQKISTQGSDLNLPILLIPISIWIVYILILSASSIIQDYGLPPRFPLLVFLPFFILTGLFYYRNRDNAAFGQIPLKWTTFYQSFRILVEVMLLYTFYKGLIPEEATFEGYNFDILIGISAVFVGTLLAGNIPKYRGILTAWNILGIIMVLIVGFIIGGSIYNPSLFAYDSPAVSKDFLSLPYFLIPGFLAPSAIFIHVVALLQIRNQ